MAEYSMPGGDQRSQQKFIFFAHFKKLNTLPSRLDLPDDELAWLENLQPLGDPPRLVAVPAPAAAPTATIPENITFAYYAAINGQDYAILFTTAGSGWFVNFSNGTVGQFAPDGTFSNTPDCTTWQASRILINDSVSGYCTWDGTLFVQQGGLSPNMQVINGGANYGGPPAVTVVVNTGSVSAITFGSGGSFTAPGAGTYNLNITAPPPGGLQASATAVVTGPTPFKVTAVTITNPGGGYSTAPTVTLPGVTGTAPPFVASLGPVGGGSNGATATSQVTNGQVTGVTLTNSGAGFNPTDTVTLTFASTSGAGAVITPTMSGAGIASLNITNQGAFSGVTAGTYGLVSTGGGGSGAAATVTVTGFQVLSVAVTNPGSGYTSVPSVSWDFAGHPITGTPPTFTANMGNVSVASLAVSAGGTGYAISTTLNLVFSLGQGAPQATGTATTSAGGVVTGATRLTGGSYPFGHKPTVTVAAGSGASASAHVWPTVPNGTTLAVFQGRVWLNGTTPSGFNLLQWTGTGASFNNVGYDDFLAADASGSLQIVDADLVHAITALRSLNNYLWIMGDQSVKQIGNITVSGTPSVTLFNILTLSSDQGTIWPKTCISYNRIFMFANANGVYGVFGSTVQKISDDLDRIFQSSSFTGPPPQAAIVDLSQKHNAVFLLQVPGPRSLLLVFDGKRWWLANQGTNLGSIVTWPRLSSGLNVLYGSLNATDMTQLFANQNIAVPFRVQSALSAGGNLIQGKRLIRAGFNASVGGTTPEIVNFSLDNELNPAGGINNYSLQVTGAYGYSTIGGANDMNNKPMATSGMFLGMTLTGNVLPFFSVRYMVIEYQETQLWKGAG